MKAIKNIGIIDCRVPGQNFQVEKLSHLNGYSIKKVWVTNSSSTGNIRLQYPEVEIVNDKSSIIEDSSIDLVIVSAAAALDLDTAGEILKAGKHLWIL